MSTHNICFCREVSKKNVDTFGLKKAMRLSNGFVSVSGQV